MQNKVVKIDFRLIEYNSPEYRQMVALRDEVLRKPLGLAFSKEDLEKEKEDMLISAFADDDLVGCCILTWRDGKMIQLRQMAVNEAFRNQNVGLRLLAYAEQVAEQAGFETLMMHAREVAAGFYKKAGYQISGDSFTEVGIPHYLMVKKLATPDA